MAKEKIQEDSLALDILRSFKKQNKRLLHISTISVSGIICAVLIGVSNLNV